MEEREVEYINESGYIKKEKAIVKSIEEIAKIKNIRAFCTTADQKHDLFVDDKYNMYVTK